MSSPGSAGPSDWRSRKILPVRSVIMFKGSSKPMFSPGSDTASAKPGISSTTFETSPAASDTSSAGPDTPPGTLGVSSSESALETQSSITSPGSHDSKEELSELLKHLDEKSLRALFLKACEKDQELYEMAWTLLDKQKMSHYEPFIFRAGSAEHADPLSYVSKHAQFYSKAIWIVDNIRPPLNNAGSSSASPSLLGREPQKAIEAVPELCDFVIRNFVFSRPPRLEVVILGLAKLFLALLDVLRGFIEHWDLPGSALKPRLVTYSSSLTDTVSNHCMIAEKQAERVGDILLKVVEALLASPPPLLGSMGLLPSKAIDRTEKDIREEYKSSVLRFAHGGITQTEDSIGTILQRIEKYYGVWTVSLPVCLAHRLLMPSSQLSTTISDKKDTRPGLNTSGSRLLSSEPTPEIQNTDQGSIPLDAAGNKTPQVANDQTVSTVHTTSVVADGAVPEVAGSGENSLADGEAHDDDESKPAVELSGVTNDAESATDIDKDIFELPTNDLPSRSSPSKTLSKNSEEASAASNSDKTDSVITSVDDTDEQQ